MKSQPIPAVSTNKSLFFFIIVLTMIILSNVLFYVFAFKNPPELIEVPHQRQAISPHLSDQPKAQSGNQP